MSHFFIIVLFSLSHLCFSFDTKPFVSSDKYKDEKVKLRPVWAVNTFSSQGIKPSLNHNSSPLLTKKLVIQSNGWTGLQAFTKKSGKMVWKFNIEGGSFSPLTEYKDHIYFGASDGFFYSLNIKTGKMAWKFFTGSENLSGATIDKGIIYWLANNQKIYALDLKGSLIWVYAGSSLTSGMHLRSRPQPTIYGNSIFVGLHDGTLLSLNKKNGRLKWKKSLSSKSPVSGELFTEGKCLFASIFEFKTYCLNPANGQVRWSIKGDDILFPRGSYFYQISKDGIKAFEKSNLKLRWSKKIEGYPIKPRVYKNYLIYGSSSDGRLYAIDKNSSKVLGTYLFGNGLSAPVTLDEKTGEIYLFSINAYLHKLRLN